MGCVHSRPPTDHPPMMVGQAKNHHGSSTHSTCCRAASSSSRDENNTKPSCPSPEAPLNLNSACDEDNLRHRASLRHHSLRNSETACSALARGDSGIRAAGLISDWDVGKLADALKGNTTVRKLSVEIDFNKECGPRGVADLMSGIRNCPGLEEVHLVGTGDQGARAVGEFLIKNRRRGQKTDDGSSHLKVLHLSNGSRMTQASARTLGRAVRSKSAGGGIKELRLPSNEIGDAEVTCLAEELFTPRYSMNGKRRASSSLYQGYISPRRGVSPSSRRSGMTGADPKGWAPLELPIKKRSSSLSRLDFSSRLPAFARKSSSSLSLHVLDLSSNRITDDGCRALADALETANSTPTSSSATVLESLSLRRNRIRSAEPLSTLFFLKELRLGYNQLGLDPSELHALGDLFRFGRLEVLELEGNQIDSAGAEAIAYGLRRAATMRELYLSHNPLGNAGVEALCAAMPNSIEVLHIRNCNLDAGVTPILARTVARLTNIKELVVSENSLGNTGLEELAMHGIRFNSNIERFFCERDQGGLRDPEATEVVLSAIRCHRSIRQVSLRGSAGIANKTSSETIARAIVALHSERARMLTVLCSALEVPSATGMKTTGNEVLLVAQTRMNSPLRAKYNPTLLRMLPIELIRAIAIMLYGA